MQENTALKTLYKAFIMILAATVVRLVKNLSLKITYGEMKKKKKKKLS